MSVPTGQAGRSRRAGWATGALAACIVAGLVAPAPLAAADAPGKAGAPKEDLAAVRKQIESLQKSLEAAEG